MTHRNTSETERHIIEAATAAALQSYKRRKEAETRQALFVELTEKGFELPEETGVCVTCRASLPDAVLRRHRRFGHRVEF